MKEMLHEVRYLKSSEGTILALAGQFKQLSHEPEIQISNTALHTALHTAPQIKYFFCLIGYSLMHR